MTTTFTWKISQLERETQDGFVFVAHYVVDASDGIYTSGACGSTSFQRPDNLIPYAELTEELVVDWVKNALGGDAKVAEIEAALEEQISQQRTPTKAFGLPWAN